MELGKIRIRQNEYPVRTYVRSPDGHLRVLDFPEEGDIFRRDILVKDIQYAYPSWRLLR